MKYRIVKRAERYFVQQKCWFWWQYLRKYDMGPSGHMLSWPAPFTTQMEAEQAAEKNAGWRRRQRRYPVIPVKELDL